MKNKPKIKTTKSKTTTKAKAAKKAVKKTAKATKAKAAKKTTKKAKVVKKTAKKTLKKAVKKATKAVKKVKKAKVVKKTAKAAKSKSVKKATKVKAVKKAVRTTAVKAAKKIIKKVVTPKITSQTTQVDTTQVGNDSDTADDSSDSSHAKGEKSTKIYSPGTMVKAKPLGVKTASASEKRKIKLKTTVKRTSDKKDAFMFLANEAEVLDQNIETAHFAKQKAVGEHVDTAAFKVKILEENSGFVFVLPGSRKIMNLDEMRSIVRICHTARNKDEAAVNMYQWFSDNRQDIIADCFISKTDNTILGKLYSLVIATYKLKGA